MVVLVLGSYAGAAVVVHGHMHCVAYTCWSKLISVCNMCFPILCAWIMCVGLRCSHALQLARYGRIEAVTCNVNFSLYCIIIYAVLS